MTAALFDRLTVVDTVLVGDCVEVAPKDVVLFEVAEKMSNRVWTAVKELNKVRDVAALPDGELEKMTDAVEKSDVDDVRLDTSDDVPLKDDDTDTIVDTDGE